LLEDGSDVVGAGFGAGEHGLLLGVEGAAVAVAGRGFWWWFEEVGELLGGGVWLVGGEVGEEAVGGVVVVVGDAVGGGSDPAGADVGAVLGSAVGQDVGGCDQEFLAALGAGGG
jgi:hypothetical protein